MRNDLNDIRDGASIVIIGIGYRANPLWLSDLRGCIIYYPSFPLRAEKGGTLAKAGSMLFVELFYSKTGKIT